MTRRTEFGLSVYELMIVVTILLIGFALVTPLISTTVNSYRLRGGGADYASLIQTSRMRAVQDDQYHPVILTTGAATSYNAYVDVFGNSTYTSGDPAVLLPSAVQIASPSSAPATANLRSQYLPSGCGTNGACVTVNPNSWGPTFGPRGLPCQATAQTGGTCSYLSGSGTGGINGSAGNLPIAFEAYLQNTQAGTWEAVTVNPSGRVRLWSYDTVSSTWRPLN